MSKPAVPLAIGAEADSSSLLQTLLRISPTAIYMLDCSGCVRLWNPAAERVFGWREAEVLGRPDPTVAGRKEALRLFVESVLSADEAIEQKAVRYARGGTAIDVALSAARIGGRDEPLGVIAIAADNSSRNLLEPEWERLLVNERQARAVAEAAERRTRFLAEGSALLDGSLDYAATLNNLARLAVPSLADYCLIDELEGDSVSRVALAHVNPEREAILQPRVRQPLTGDPDKHPVVRVMLTGVSVIVEEVDEAVLEEIAHSEQHLVRLRELELHSFLVVPLSTRGKIFGALTLAYAESRRRYSPADLEIAEELARRATAAVEAARLYRESRRAVQARERLLAIVSHDLRNSLATVLLNASALLEHVGLQPLERPIHDQLQWITRSAEQMNRLISDLLDASAIELGRFSLYPSRHSASSLLAEAAQMFRPLCAEKQITFSTEFPAALPDIFVDPERLQQVLGNLLGNAVKFAPPKSAISLRADATGAAEVRFQVTDEGPGIEADHLASIFDLYWQGQRGRRKGAGLGLGIAKAIVDGLGGRIWVESVPGQGSTFSFTVPTWLSWSGTRRT